MLFIPLLATCLGCAQTGMYTPQPDTSSAVSFLHQVSTPSTETVTSPTRYIDQGDVLREYVTEYWRTHTPLAKTDAVDPSNKRPHLHIIKEKIENEVGPITQLHIDTTQYTDIYMSNYAVITRMSDIVYNSDYTTGAYLFCANPEKWEYKKIHHETTLPKNIVANIYDMITEAGTCGIIQIDSTTQNNTLHTIDLDINRLAFGVTYTLGYNVMGEIQHHTTYPLPGIVYEHPSGNIFLRCYIECHIHFKNSHYLGYVNTLHTNNELSLYIYTPYARFREDIIDFLTVLVNDSMVRSTYQKADSLFFHRDNDLQDISTQLTYTDNIDLSVFTLRISDTYPSPTYPSASDALHTTILALMDTDPRRVYTTFNERENKRHPYLQAVTINAPSHKGVIVINMKDITATWIDTSYTEVEWVDEYSIRIGPTLYKLHDNTRSKHITI